MVVIASVAESSGGLHVMPLRTREPWASAVARDRRLEPVSRVDGGVLMRSRRMVSFPGRFGSRRPRRKAGGMVEAAGVAMDQPEDSERLAMDARGRLKMP